MKTVVATGLKNTEREKERERERHGELLLDSGWKRTINLSHCVNGCGNRSLHFRERESVIILRCFFCLVFLLHDIFDAFAS